MSALNLEQQEVDEQSALMQIPFCVTELPTLLLCFSFVDLLKYYFTVILMLVMPFKTLVYYIIVTFHSQAMANSLGSKYE